MRRRLAALLSLEVVGFSAEMARDDERTLAELKRVFRSVVRPAMRDHGGRVVKLLGDGALAEFPAASAALACAARIQTEMVGDPVRLRAGVHVGEITEESGDVFGDAVNVASRLQTAAPEGGALVSRTAADMAGSVAGVTLKPKGLHSFRNIPYPIEMLSVDLDDHGARKERLSRLAEAQEIRFARSSDGVRLAWTAIGQGRPMVKSPNWIQHLERDRASPAAVMLATMGGSGPARSLRQPRQRAVGSRGQGLFARSAGR